MKQFLPIVLILSMIACSTKKKSSKSKIEEPAITLDTIKVTPPSTAVKEIYRATNTLQNDIIHTLLQVKFDWQKSQLTGTANISATPYMYPSSVFYLNARGMEIKDVRMGIEMTKTTTVVVKGKKMEVTETSLGQKPAMYKYENDSLKITLDRTYSRGETFYVSIDYIAKPDELEKGGSSAISSDKGLYFINPRGEEKDKMPQIWTQGETQSNSAWFPTVDSPNEKMKTDIFITVEEKYTTLSNGILLNSKKNADGTRTDHWNMDLPHSPYLVMMGIGEFKKVTDTPWNGKEISYYVEKEYESDAKAIFGNTREMIEFYSNALGTPYPWQKYSQIVVRDYVSGAMENTSATLHGDFMVYQHTRDTVDGIKGEDVIAHELFHQWFGDFVTAESWSNLPLNESFATYGEYLWEEHKYGRDAADEHHAGSRFGYFASSSQSGEVNLIRFNYGHREEMFDAFSYNKGGQVLHMLRKYLGDDAFFAGLKLYLANRKFNSGEIHDLRLAFEEVTKQDLNWFFNEWFLNKSYPRLDVLKNYDAATKTLSLTVRQKQDLSEAPLYTLPVDIDIYFGGKKERKRIWINDVKQTFVFNVETQPDLVNFDAERQLLAKINYEKTKSEYIFQYKNAGLWGDRDEALDYFKGHTDDNEVYEILKYAAQNDKWKNFRSDAIGFIEKVAKSKESEVRPLLMNSASKDASSKVRASAIKTLSGNYKAADLDALYEKALGDKSYLVIAEALDAIAKTNTVVAMQKAKTLENEPNKKISFAIADLYSQYGTDDNFDFFSNAKTRFNGFDLLGFGNLYGRFLKRCTKEETILKGATEIAAWAKSPNQYVRYGSLKVLKNLIDNQPNADTKNKLTDIYNSVK